MNNEARLLFVDDEPGIRSTLPVILRQHGFQVEVAGNVPDALNLINSCTFDVLISDLNIGSPGDGFTIVSAMRRTQPNCRNMILTGYPGFESALQAIRNQVDAYLIKPTNIRTLIQQITASLEEPPRLGPAPSKGVAEVICAAKQEVIDRTVQAMRNHPEVSPLPLTDAERANDLPELIDDLCAELRSSACGYTPTMALRAAEHGRVRFRQGYSLPDLVEDVRMLDQAIYEVVQTNLLAVDLSTILPNLRLIDDALDRRLKESLRGYMEMAGEAG